MTDELNTAHPEPAPSGIPPALDTPETEKLISDAKTDVSAIAQAAAADAKAEVDTAVTAAGKLLAIAAGDEQVLLTDAEAAAVSLVAHQLPAPWNSEVLAFAQSLVRHRARE